MGWVVGFFCGGDAVGRGGAEGEGFESSTVVLNADIGGARSGADGEHGAEDRGIDAVEDEFAS